MTPTSLSRRSLLAALGLAPAAAVARTPTVRSGRAPVRILYTRVNGEPYYDALRELDRIVPGAPVLLRREPANRYDKRAIEVLTPGGGKLGYVARSDNPALARMMDAGERFEARVARVDKSWLDIRLEVFWLPG